MGGESNNRFNTLAEMIPAWPLPPANIDGVSHSEYSQHQQQQEEEVAQPQQQQQQGQQFGIFGRTRGAAEGGRIGRFNDLAEMIPGLSRVAPAVDRVSRGVDHQQKQQQLQQGQQQQVGSIGRPGGVVGGESVDIFNVLAEMIPGQLRPAAAVDSSRSSVNHQSVELTPAKRSDPPRMVEGSNGVGSGGCIEETGRTFSRPRRTDPAFPSASGQGGCSLAPTQVFVTALQLDASELDASECEMPQADMLSGAGVTGVDGDATSFEGSQPDMPSGAGVTGVDDEASSLEGPHSDIPSGTGWPGVDDDDEEEPDVTDTFIPADVPPGRVLNANPWCCGSGKAVKEPALLCEGPSCRRWMCHPCRITKSRGNACVTFACCNCQLVVGPCWCHR